jgi:DNA polymerase III alpha subunit (gram-positive type)
MDKKRYLVIDCETTGLSPRNNQVLTVGLLLIEVLENTIEIIDSEHILVKHERYNVSGIALKINKINLEEHHQNAIPVFAACDNIDRFIEKHGLKQCVIIGHNIRFDIGFLGELYRLIGRDFSFYSDFIDTMALWRELKNKGRVPRELKSNLKTVARYLGIDCQGAHNALVDCHITANVYFNLKEFINRINE